MTKPSRRIPKRASASNREKTVRNRPHPPRKKREEAAASRESTATLREVAAGLREDAAGSREETSTLREDTATRREDAVGRQEDAAGSREETSTLREEREGAVTAREGTAALREVATGLRENAAGSREKTSTLREDTATWREDAVGRQEDAAGSRGETSTLREDTATRREDAASLQEGTGQAKGALRDLLDLFDQTGTVAKVGGWQLDVGTQTLYWTAEVYRILEVGPTIKPTIAEWSQFFAPEARPVITAAVQAAIDAGTPFDLELPLVTGQGRRIWVCAQGIAKRRDGKTIRLYGAFQDITGRKRTETALRESEARFRTIFEEAPLGAALIDSLTGHICEVNPRFADIAGQTRAAMASIDWMSITHPDDVQEDLDRMALLNAGKIPGFNMNKRYRRPDGSYVWINMTIAPLTSDDKRHPQHLCMIEDITERRRVEDALRQAEEKYRSIFDHALNGIYQTTPNGTFITANPAMAHILGYTSPEELTAQLTDVASLGYADRAGRAEFLRLLERDGVVQGLEYEALCKDGRRRWVSENARAVRNAEGVVQYYEGTLTDITERKQEEEAKGRLVSILNATPDLVSIADPEGRFVYLNDAGRKMLGIEKLADLTRYNLREFHDVASVQAILNAGLPTAMREGAWSGETTFVALDGHATTVSQVILAHQAPNGTVTYLSTIARDITQRRQTEDALRRHEQLLAQSQHMAHLGSWTHDLETGLITWSDELFRIYGVLSDGFAPTVDSFLSLIHPDDRSTMRLTIATMLSEKRSVQAAFRVVLPDGTIREIEAINDVQVNAENQPIRLIGTAQDVTERKKAEATMSLESAALNAAANAIVITDRDGVIQWVNSAVTASSGYDISEALGKNPRDLFKSGVHDRAFYEQMWATLVAGNVWRGEMVNRRKDGTHYTEDTTITPIKDDRGAISHFIAVKQDITERKQLEQQFLRAQRLESIGTLAGGIAHDLRNVLGPIVMSADLLRLAATDDDSRSLIDTIGVSAQRGADMATQMLSFARGLEGRRVPVQVRHLIRELEKFARESFPKEIRIRTTASKDLWTVLGDPTQLHQVLLNLCVNARDAMPEGGTLTITADNATFDAKYAAANIDAQAGPYVVIQIEDTGMGIPRVIIDKIFDPFFTTKAVGQGTGLGLSTSLTIVKQHGGFLRVTSEPGVGTRFRMCLPAQPEHCETTEMAAVELPRGSGETVLVVDDEAAVREITRRTLEAFGYRVLLASDGAEAVTLYARHAAEIAVVIMDVMMPVMSGASAIEVLVKMNPAIRILAVSGGAAGRDALPKAGADAIRFLSKPYSVETLLQALREELAKAGDGNLDLFQSVEPVLERVADVFRPRTRGCVASCHLSATANASSRAAREKGFTRYAITPACMLTLGAIVLTPVARMTAVMGYLFRIWRVSQRPSSPGICTSQNTTSAGVSAIEASAAWACSASRIWCPRSLTQRLIRSRMTLSSSTISRSATVAPLTLLYHLCTGECR
jgi:PAS domain S-box-containing protein